ncbi:hypothetical protein CAPTEDRAFT_38826, partial [Capitella teleta]
VLLMIKHGVDINIGDKEWESPLHLACFHRYERLVKLLLAFGASVNARDVYRQTPLHVASATGDICIAEWLLKYESD